MGRAVLPSLGKAPPNSKGDARRVHFAKQSVMHTIYHSPDVEDHAQLVRKNFISANIHYGAVATPTRGLPYLPRFVESSDSGHFIFLPQTDI